MRIGDQEWRKMAAKLLRDTRRLMGRDFAKTVTLPGIRDAKTNRVGETIQLETQH